MAGIRPIHHRKFEKFLLYVGCRLARQVGDHKMYVRPGLARPIVVRTLKDLPVTEIKSNLRTLNISTEEYLNIMERL